MFERKIINDPVFGFINIPKGLLYDVVRHPLLQRLNRIKQLGLSSVVYPGAQHTRFQHSLGAFYLMSEAIQQLATKGNFIFDSEAEAVEAAILMHDIGHGPFSHVLENTIVQGVSHEDISLMLMERINKEMNGQLTLAIQIFKDEYPKRFLHQLVSGQLDMDRLDYLRRDSFYTGVTEGNIGSARIIKYFYSNANPDFMTFKNLDNRLNGYGLHDNFKSIYGIYNLLMKNATKQLNDKQPQKEKTPMVFISHSSKDKSFVEALVDLLESLGLTKNNLFCSSVDGYGIPLGYDIFETIRSLFQEHELYVIFTHSPRYYESHVSLNEMGAAWVLKTDFCSILTKDMEFKNMTGVVNNSSLSIKVDSEDAPARLTEMKDRLVNMIGLIPIDEIKWERKRVNFLRLVLGHS